jgi:hypothetical protein
MDQQEPECSIFFVTNKLSVFIYLEHSNIVMHSIFDRSDQQDIKHIDWMLKLIQPTNLGILPAI